MSTLIVTNLRNLASPFVNGSLNADGSTTFNGLINFAPNQVFPTYSGTGAPPSPQTGDTWYDTTTPPGTFKIYDGSAWQPVGGGGGGSGTVTSVSGSGGTTGLTLTGGPITASGTLTLGGILAVANGGTGASTLAGLQAAALPTQAPGDAGKFLTTNGSTASWASAAAGGVTAVSGTAPIVSSGGATPAISITAATTGALGAVQVGTNIDVAAGTISVKNASATDKGVIEIATLAEAATGTDATRASTPETSVPKDASGMTGAALIPTGTTGQRPATGVIGMARFSTDTGFDPSGNLEVFTKSSNWRQLAYTEVPAIPPANLTFSTSQNISGTYYCNNLTVDAGVTLTVNKNIAVVFICTGNVVINGTISANAAAGTLVAQISNGSFITNQPGIGYGWSEGTYSPSVTAAGSSVGSGRIQTNSAAGRTAYSAVGGAGGGAIIIRSQGTIIMGAAASLQAEGGAAVSGFVSGTSNGGEIMGGAGGGSGGLVCLRADKGITTAGTISVNGGAGCNAFLTDGGWSAFGGGGGGGGWIILQTPGTLTNGSTNSLNGAPGGTSAGSGSSPMRGTGGAGYGGAGGAGGQSSGSPDGLAGSAGVLAFAGSPL